MARHFHYHSLAEIVTDCQRLNLDLRFRDDLAPLFRPVPVGPLRAGNALCVQPMEGCDATLDGKPDELTFRRFRRFGAGGCKLIWGEAAAVVPEGRANPRQLLAVESNAADLARMLEACRQAHRQTFGSDDDLIVGLQLTHSGRFSQPRPWPAVDDPYSPSAVVPITDDELDRLADAYVAAARIAWRAGFQFVDIKQCHRYLLNELLSARTRPGRYGGSYENRTRLARDILTAIRAEVPGLVLASRLGVFDSVPYRKGPDGVGTPMPWAAPFLHGWGTALDDPLRPDLAEPRAWIADMVRLGVAVVNVTLGNPYASPHLLRPFEVPPPDGYQAPEHPLIGVARHVELTGQLQEWFPDLPLVGSGYSWLQEYLPQAGSANLHDGRCRFVGLGRMALTAPDLAVQLQATGRLDRKRICRTFSYCTALMRSKHNALGQFATGCPPFDRETYGPLWDQARQTAPAP